MTAPPRLKRLEARVTAEQKERYERAARLQGRTLTDFMLGALEAAASQAIREHEILTLSARDSLTFVRAILDPPDPSPSVLEAARRYRELVEER